MPMQADLRQVVYALSDALDLVGVDDVAHGKRVGVMAAECARSVGWPADRVQFVFDLGLLHDIGVSSTQTHRHLGKLRVPDQILDKPGRLDENERLTMKCHSFETQQILRNIKGFEEIGAWAAHHHEEPGGGGYPFGLDAAQLPLEARILRVADIFQAMLQHRPYRPGLGREGVREFMLGLRDQGRIDARIGAVLLAHLDEMIALALLDDGGSGAPRGHVARAGVASPQADARVPS